MNKVIFHYRLFFLFTFCIQVVLNAQQLPIYQHSSIIRSAYNPAETINNKNEAGIFILRGNQFTKFEGGFTNNYINFSTPLKMDKIGVGLEVSSRSFGIINQLSAGLSYAYRAKINDRTNITFGLRLGFMEHKFNKFSLVVYQPEDIVIDQLPTTGNLIPNGNFGITLNSKIGALEFSLPQLFSNRYFRINAKTNNFLILDPHLFSRYSIELGKNKSKFSISPVVSVRYLPKSIAQFEAGLLAWFNQKIWISMNYRSDYSLAIGGGIRIDNTWNIGYSYDRAIVNRFNFYNASHEVLLGYTFVRAKQKLPEIEWNQAQSNVPKAKMDSVSNEQDLDIANEYLKNKLAKSKQTEDTLYFEPDPGEKVSRDYKSIQVEINLMDSVFRQELISSQSNNTSISKNKKDKTSDEPLTQERIDKRIQNDEENELLRELNKNREEQIKIVRNTQPDEKYFVDIIGDESPRGYYLITGVFSTLQRAQNFRWQSDADKGTIIVNKKNNYFYVVHLYSRTKSVNELEKILREFRATNKPIWILDY